MKKTKKPKIPRNYIAVAHSMRKGAGAGPHTKKGYTRKVKHVRELNEQ